MKKTAVVGVIGSGRISQCVVAVRWVLPTASHAMASVLAVSCRMLNVRPLRA